MAKLICVQKNGSEVWEVDGKKYVAPIQLHVGPGPEFKRTTGVSQRGQDGSPIVKYRVNGGGGGFVGRGMI